MDVTKCDKCGKNKTDKNKWIRTSVSGQDVGYRAYDICEKCGSGILAILKKNFKEDKK
ncbi:MAG: hypothetical protein V1732_04160 [Patescibacteria group bacterium]